MLKTNQKPLSFVTGSKQVQLVNPDGSPNGAADIFAAHRYPSQLHAAVSVWLTRPIQSQSATSQLDSNPQLEVLFQQRSSQKIVGALQWANTVCGNVKPNEAPLSAAQRRLQEELNLEANSLLLQPIYTFTYKAFGSETYGEHEFDHVFLATLSKSHPKSPKNTTKTETNLTISPNPAEVNATAWLPVAQLQTWATSLTYPSVSDTLKLDHNHLEQQTQPQIFTYKNQHFLIAAWTILMLRDPRLLLLPG